ncbi:MAG: hypothetical protein E7050_02910 [Lentisphaerae bacterium]|nr:hypothetical protein [Lentisphaerota bacterium]
MSAQNINCPLCNGLLQIPEQSVSGEMTVNCPLCNGQFTLQIEIEPVPQSPAPQYTPVPPAGKTNTGKKKILILTIAAAAVVIAAAVILTAVLTSGDTRTSVPAEKAKTSSTAATAPAEKSTAKETVTEVPEKTLPQKAIETAEKTIILQQQQQFSQLLAAPDTTIEEITEFLMTATDSQVFETAFLKTFDQQFQKADNNGKYELLQIAGKLNWQSITRRREQFCEANEQLLHNAVQTMDAETIKNILPLAKKLNINPELVKRAEIIPEAITVIKRGDMKELKSFIDNCSDSKIKTQLKNKFDLEVHGKINALHMQAIRSFQQGDLTGAKKILAEMKSIAPDHEKVVKFSSMLDTAEKSPVQPPHNSGNRQRHNSGNRRRPPIQFQLVSACLRGMRSEVISLMDQGVDLHGTLTSSDSNGQKTKSTIFMHLLKRVKPMPAQSPRGAAARSCLIAILEKGFVPNEEEKEFIRQNLPELAEFIR